MFALKKQPDRDFIVLNITDPQLTGREWESGGREKQILTYTIDELVKRTSPDLITISGDLSYSNDLDSYREFAKLFDGYKIPWALVWGNHDSQGGPEAVERQVGLITKHEFCLYERGDSSLGNGNYTIAIEEDGKIIYALIMMDSHDTMDYTDPDGKTSRQWAHLLPQQLEWYKSEVERLGGVKSAIIMHIPIYAFRTAFEAAWNSEYDPESVLPLDSYDTKYWNDGYKDSFGVKYEGVCSYPADLGEFEFIKNVGSTDTILVGHDHVNNFVINYEGIKLAYSLKTGMGCYWNKHLNGGTVLRISSAGSSLEHVFVDINTLG